MAQRPNGSSRLLPIVALAFLGALPAVRYLQNGGPLLSLVGMVVGAVDIGILPGLLLSALVGAVGAGSVLEASAVGFGASFALVQVLTMAALWRHVSVPIVVAALWTGCGLLALILLAWPPRYRWTSGVGRWQWLIVGLALVLGASLYMQSPFEPWITGEDAIHVSVIQRLAFEPRPRLSNIYYAPQFIYTYPFPGIHYFDALVSRATNLDALFVYQKIRLLWGPIALFTLYAAARVIFQSDRVAFASALAAVVLTLSGAFGPISATWGQLAPVSHASDVAMTVILPTLLLFALNFATADTMRAAAFYFLGTMALVASLTIVHIREVVQFLVYTGAACAVYFMFLQNRRMAFRFGLMAGSTLLLVVEYLRWYQRTVGHVDAVVAQRRVILVDAIAGMSARQFLTPIFLHGYFTVNHEYFFYMWFPLILLLAPLVLLAYRSRPLVPFIGASLLAYAIIVFIPLAAIVYVYVTYYEILFTPVRNSLFFIYLLAGPLLLMAADSLRLITNRRRQITVALAGLVAVGLAYLFFDGFFKHSQNLNVQNVFFLALIAGYTVAIVNGRRLADRLSRLAADPPDGWELPAMAPFLVLLAFAALIGFSWRHSPLKFDITSSKWTSRQYLAWMPDMKVKAVSTFHDPETGANVQLAETEALAAPPTPELADFGRRRLPVNAVLVHNIYNTYASPAFMPQQILMFPVDSSAGLEFNARLFPGPWAALLRTAEAYNAQPFFNESETLEERSAYMTEVGATHVLVDPMYYARLRPLFAKWTPTFESAYDDGRRWAVLAFKPPSSHTP